MTTPRSRGRAALTGAALLGMLVALGLALAWQLQGGRWFDVTTPSMGTALPVGTLVVTRPVAAADVEVGDVVTFRSPRSGETYTHRVVRADARGLLTQGDINDTPDGAPVTGDDLVGRVVWHADGVGWLLRGVPLLLLGVAVVWLATARVREPMWRTAWRRAGAAVVVAVVAWWLRPWVGLVRLGQATPPGGEDGVLMRVVSTGLLPIRVDEVGGPASAALSNGEVGELHLTVGQERGRYDLTSAIDLPWWGWGVVVLCCLSPLLVNLAVGLPAEREAGRHADAPADEQDLALAGGRS